MKIAEFLEKLGKTPRIWRLEGRAIRCESGLCPIEALAGRRGPYSQGKEMGLRWNTIHMIVEGADCSRPSLWRKRLLKACGLK